MLDDQGSGASDDTGTRGRDDVRPGESPTSPQRTCREWSMLSVVLALCPAAEPGAHEDVLPLLSGAPVTFLSLRPVGQATEHALDALSQHHDPDVRRLLACREDLPEDTAAVLAMDDDEDVLVALVDNPAVDDLLVTGVVAWRGSRAVRAANDRRTSLAVPTQRAQRASPPLEDVPDDEEPWTPPWLRRGQVSVDETARTLAQVGWSPGRPLSDAWSEETVTGLVRRTQDLHLLESSAVAADPALRVAAAGNRALSEHLVTQLCGDDDVEVRLSALIHPLLPVDLLEEALGDAEQLLHSDQHEDAGHDLVHALGWSPVATRPVLDRLVRLGSSGAALRMLSVPAAERPDLTDSTLLDLALGEQHALPLHLTPLQDLPMQARVALADDEHLDRAEVVKGVGGDPDRFDELVDEVLHLWRSDGGWDPYRDREDWPTLIADSPGCTDATAQLILREHRQHERALRGLIDNEALSASVRVAALRAYGSLDRDTSHYLGPDRAEALGRALLAIGLPVEQVVALAEVIDAQYGDALHAAAFGSTEAVVAAALPFVLARGRAAAAPAGPAALWGE